MILKQIHISLILIVLAIINFSCGKESSCFKGSGEDIEEMRNITSNITTIILEDNIDLVISQDSEASFKIYGGSNLLPYINTNISGNELKISSDNKCGFFRNYKRAITAYLTLPNIEEIEMKGQGNLTSAETLVYDNFNLETRNATGSINLSLNVNNLSIKQHTGPADFTLKGLANTAYYYTGGNGWMYFNNLIANQVHVNHSGSGNVLVNATNTLYVELLSSGDVNYYGNPNIQVLSNAGSGNIVKK